MFLLKAWSRILSLVITVIWHFCVAIVLLNMFWLGALTLRVISRLDATPCMYMGAGALVGIGEGLLKEIRCAICCGLDVGASCCTIARGLDKNGAFFCRNSFDGGRHYQESPIKYNFADFYRAARPSPSHTRMPATVDMSPVKRRLFDGV
jgi:hypothetical protein